MQSVTHSVTQPGVTAAPCVALYDHQGVFRFAGVLEADCLAYADLFALAAGTFTLASLEPCPSASVSRAGCSS